MKIRVVQWNLAALWTRDKKVRELKLQELEKLLLLYDVVLVDEAHIGPTDIDFVEAWGVARGYKIFVHNMTQSRRGLPSPSVGALRESVGCSSGLPPRPCIRPFARIAGVRGSYCAAERRG